MQNTFESAQENGGIKSPIHGLKTPIHALPNSLSVNGRGDMGFADTSSALSPILFNSSRDTLSQVAPTFHRRPTTAVLVPLITEYFSVSELLDLKHISEETMRCHFRGLLLGACSCGDIETVQLLLSDACRSWVEVSFQFSPF